MLALMLGGTTNCFIDLTNGSIIIVGLLYWPSGLSGFCRATSLIVIESTHKSRPTLNRTQQQWLPAFLLLASWVTNPSWYVSRQCRTPFTDTALAFVQSRKNHGTSETPVMKNLRWGCDWETADRICNFNRHYAEFSGYYEKTDFVKQAQATSDGETIQFYDSNSGKLLFTAPVGRSMDDFLQESRAHGWPSYVYNIYVSFPISSAWFFRFRDQETNWEYVRCLPDGETVSVDGTHLGTFSLVLLTV